jgi:hypothetical protein
MKCIAASVRSGTKDRGENGDRVSRGSWSSRGTLVSCFALADGAGSSPHGPEAAEYLSSSFAQAVRSAFGDRVGGEVRLRDPFFCLCDGLRRFAISKGRPPSQFLSTFVGAVHVSPAPGAGDPNLIVASVGDSAAFVELAGPGGGSVFRSHPVSKGEYANETRFLAGGEWESAYWERQYPNARGLVLASDGLAGIWFGYERRNPSPWSSGWVAVPDERILSSLLRHAAKGDMDDAALAGVLGDESISRMNQDDKSALAVWFSGGKP